MTFKTELSVGLFSLTQPNPNHQLTDTSQLYPSQKKNLDPRRTGPTHQTATNFDPTQSDPTYRLTQPVANSGFGYRPTQPPFSFWPHSKAKPLKTGF